jgi:hypothetical protein
MITWVTADILEAEDYDRNAIKQKKIDLLLPARVRALTSPVVPTPGSDWRTRKISDAKPGGTIAMSRAVILTRPMSVSVGRFAVSRTTVTPSSSIHPGIMRIFLWIVSSSGINTENVKR